MEKRETTVDKKSWVRPRDARGSKCRALEIHHNLGISVSVRDARTLLYVTAVSSCGAA